MRRTAVILCLTAVAGLSAEAVSAKPADTDPPYKLVLDKAATEAAQRAGFDLEKLVTRTADKVFTLLPHREEIKINVRLDPKNTVARIGVGSVPDPATGDVYITLDDKPTVGFRKSLAIWLPAGLARVLFLSSRIRTGSGYGITLGEALVSEGLSDHFVSQAFPRTPSRPWDHRRMTARQEAGLWKRAKPDLITPGGYDHPLWFFGAGGKKALPHWSGYTLAYRIVSPYLSKNRPPSKAVKTDAETVYKPYAQAHPTTG